MQFFKKSSKSSGPGPSLMLTQIDAPAAHRQVGLTANCAHAAVACSIVTVMHQMSLKGVGTPYSTWLWFPRTVSNNV